MDCKRVRDPDNVGCRTDVTPRRAMAFYNKRIMRIDGSRRYGETDISINRGSYLGYTADFFHVPPLIDYALSLVTNCHIHVQIEKNSVADEIVDLLLICLRIMVNINRR